MAKQPKFKPVTVEKDGVQRVADTPSRLVAFEFDGFTQVETDEPEQVKAPSAAQAGGGGSKSKGSGTADTAGSNPS